MATNYAVQIARRRDTIMEAAGMNIALLIMLLVVLMTLVNQA